jgi:hypothetical protein
LQSERLPQKCDAASAAMLCNARCKYVKKDVSSCSISNYDSDFKKEARNCKTLRLGVRVILYYMGRFAALMYLRPLGLPSRELDVCVCESIKK